MIRQCKDIPDATFIAVVGMIQESEGRWAMRWEVQAALEALFGQEIPEKIIIAKSKKLITAGFMDGCFCGCRGDYTLEVYNDRT